VTDRGGTSTIVNTADPLGLGTIWAKVNALAMKWILLIDVTFSNGVPMSGVSRHIEGRRRSDHSSLEIFHSAIPVLAHRRAPSCT
jgi:hypothetical protein